MWRPLIDRGDGTWIGVTEVAGLWVGSRDSETSPVALENPVFLWALMERPIEDVKHDFEEYWSDLSLPDTLTPALLLMSIASSAIQAGRPYWVDRALDWLESLAHMKENDGWSVRSLLVQAADSPDLPQAIRHRARRASRQGGD